MRPGPGRRLDDDRARGSAPAISRLRTRNRCRVRRAAGRPLADQQAALGDPVRTARRARPGRAGRRRRPAPPPSAPSAASAPRCAAASMPYAPPDTTVQPALAQPVARARPATCSPYAVEARDPTTATDRSASSSSRPGPRTHSATGGTGATVRSDWSRRGRRARRRRPASARAAAAPATRRPRGRPAAPRSARPARGRRGSRPARPATPTSAGCAPAPRPTRIAPHGRRPGRRRRRSARSRSCPARPTRLSHARARRTAGCASPAGGRGVLEVLVERHAAARCSRMPSASATSSVAGHRAAGQVGERPGDPQHPVEAADRQRAALQRPLGQPQRPPRGTAQRSRSSRPGHLALTASRCRPAGRPRRPGPPRPARRPTAVVSGAASAVQPGGPGDRRQRRPAGRPGRAAARTAGDGSAAGPAGCTCRRCRRPARARTGTGWPPAPAGTGPGSVADAVGPGDRDLAALQRLAQRVEHRRRELGRLVQEQHPAVGAATARPAGPGPTRRRPARPSMAVWCGA